MKIAVACDHAGFVLKDVALQTVTSLGHTALDLGTDSTDPVDYPDFAEKVGRAIQDGDADRGLILCGSGVGAAVAACKMRGVRAGLCHDVYSARQSVEHDDVNVLALGARVIGVETAKTLIEAFLTADFSGDERHVRRLAKIQALEESQSAQDAK
jgi:RpiB/LacA/LacB family sugar-phosphate isomerase